MATGEPSEASAQYALRFLVLARSAILRPISSAPIAPYAMTTGKVQMPFSAGLFDDVPMINLTQQGDGRGINVVTQGDGPALYGTAAGGAAGVVGYAPGGGTGVVAQAGSGGTVLELAGGAIRVANAGVNTSTPVFAAVPALDGFGNHPHGYISYTGNGTGYLPTSTLTGGNDIVVSPTPPAPAEVDIVSANPPQDNPYVAGQQPFRDVLQTGTSAALTQGIGAANTPPQGSVVYGPISLTFTGPKSRSFTRPSSATRAFSGLMSRWTMPTSCAHCSASHKLIA